MGVISSTVTSTTDLGQITVAALTMTQVTMTDANTEYSYTLPAGSKGFMMQNRQNGKIQVASVNGESNTNFWTLFTGQPVWKDNLNSTNTFNFYFQSPQAGQILEIAYWG